MARSGRRAPRVTFDGASPTGEPRDQDSAGAGREVGLGLTTIVSLLLIVVPLVWASVYVAQAGAAGIGNGLFVLVAIVWLAVAGAAVLLIRGLFSS